MSAYEQGWDAFCSGAEFGENPYDMGCELQLWRDWRLGWADACDEYEVPFCEGW